MRMTMKKEITRSKISSGIVRMVDGLPQATEFEVIEVLGNYAGGSKALDFIKQKRGDDYNVFQVTTTTETYEASVEDFLTIAKPVDNNETPEA